MEQVHRVIYCRTRAPASLGIRVFDGMRQWSHVAGILACGNYVVEARAFKGVIVTPLSEVIDRSSAWEITERVVPDKLAGDAWALGTVGAGYDWAGAVGSPFNRGWQMAGRFFCSRHETLWEEAAGRKVFRGNARNITPNNSFMVL